MSIKKKQLKNGSKYCFTLRYSDIYGNTKQYTSKGYDTKKEALEEEAKFRIKMTNKKVSSSSITFKQVELEYLNYIKKDIKIQSLKKLENQVKLLEPIDNMKVNDFNVQTWKQFQLYLEKKDYSVEYKNKIIRLLKRLIKYSNKFYNTNDYMLNYIENYKRVNEMKKEMQFFTYDEFQKFISVIDEYDYKVFYESLYLLGLRVGELTALKFSDVDFSKKEVSINKTLTTKLKGQLYTISSPKTVNSNRTLPIPLKLANEYEELKEQAKKKKYYTDDWFVFGNELPFRETTIQVKKNKYCKLAGVKQIRIHDFRHSFCVWALRNGISIQVVSKYMGHSKPSVTWDIYCHIMRQDLEQVSELANKLDKGM